MIYYRFGDVIRELRSRLHLTQEELAAGICSVSTIAKIESGSQMPSGRVAEALLRRMKDVGCFFAGFSQVRELEELGSWERTRARAHEERFGESLFEQQFYAYVRVLERMSESENHALLLLELLEVLVLSMPLEELYDEMLKRRTYTYLELYLLNSIALQFYQMGSLEAAARILERLHAELEGWQAQTDNGRLLFPLVCSNLAVVKLSQKQPHAARLACERGICRCLYAGLLLPLPQLYEALSDSLFSLQEHRRAQQAYARMRMLRELLAEWEPTPGRELEKLSPEQEFFRRNLFS